MQRPSAPQPGAGVPMLPGAAPFVLVEFATRGGTVRPLAFRQPVEVVVAHMLEQVRPALRHIEAAARRGLWAAGYVAYEAAAAWEPLVEVRPAGGALAWFGLFERPIELAPADVTASGGTQATLEPWSASISRAEYSAAIAAIRAAIAEGETYQANFTLRLRSRLAGDSWAYFLRLREAQRGGYAAYLDTGTTTVLSASPELFFRRDGDTLTARPMKGTARRGRWLAEDEAAAAALRASPKERAENLMIVDLLRNDIGRVAEIGSVRVPELFSVERYPTVWQMTSTVEGRLGANTTLDDLFGALFPCGSVTGAPKIATLRLLNRLERSPRGVYCGAIGYLAPGGDCVFNVPIRTVVVDSRSGLAEYGVGGGITWDSSAGAEYDEIVAKAAVLARDVPRFELLETLLLNNGRYALRERHLARIRASARYFGFPFEARRLDDALDRAAADTPAGARRVRLLLDEQGDVRCQSLPLDTQPQPLPVSLARTPVDRDDQFLANKTTNRAVYEARKAECPGVFDVLLYNRQGELTEFTTGNLVVQLDGARWTPPRTSGLLDGTLRAELLEQGQLAERTLLAADLERAEAIWLLNGVRGWVRVELIDTNK